MHLSPCKSLPAQLKGLAPAFHDRTDGVPYRLLLEAAHTLLVRLAAACHQSNHELSVAVHDDIGVMSHHDHLPFLLDAANLPYDQFVDE
jgi:hypothetical protein